MNVLVTTSTFPRWQNDQLSDFVWKQVQEMSEQYPHLQFMVLAPHHHGAKHHEHWGKVEIFRMPYFFPRRLQQLVYPVIWSNLQRRPYLILQIPLLFLSLFLATLFLIRRRKIDLVYSHWFLPQGVACGLAALLMGVPHCVSAHEAFCFRLTTKLPIFGNWLLKYFLKRCEAISVAGEASVERTRELLGPRDWLSIKRKIRSIPMGVESKFVENVQLGRGPTNDPYILFVGRFEEKKGVPVLLEAFASLASRHRRLRLVLAGDGGLREEYLRYARHLGIADRLSFVGFIHGEEKANIFAAAEMLVVPSVVAEDGNTEGLPVVLLEGLAAGLPCIATDASGAGDVIEPEINGFLIPQRSPIALAAKITQVLHLSAAQREQICMQAQKTGELYSWSNIAAEHFEHLIVRSWQTADVAAQLTENLETAAASTV